MLRLRIDYQNTDVGEAFSDFAVERSILDYSQVNMCSRTSSYGHLRSKGLCKEKKFQKSEISVEVGGWVQVSLGICFFCGKSSQNSPKPVLIFWSTLPCVFCLYILYIAKKLLVIMI